MSNRMPIDTTGTTSLTTSLRCAPARQRSLSAAARLALLLPLLSATTAAAGVVPLAPPQPIDLQAPCGGAQPTLAARRHDSGFDTAWTTGDALWAMTLRSDGTSAGPPIRLAIGAPREPAIVVLAAGGLAVFWFDPTRGKLLTRWNVDGQWEVEREVGPAGSNRGSGFGGLSARALPGGGAAVLWTNGESVLLRQYDAQGGESGAAQTVEQYVHGGTLRTAPLDPQLLVRADGSLLAAWVLGLLGGTLREEGDIVVERVPAAPGLGGLFAAPRVVAHGRRPALTAAPGDGFLLAWATSSALDNVSPPVPGILARRFGADDEPLGEQRLVDRAAGSQLGRVVAATASGGQGFAVAWEEVPLQLPDHVLAIVFLRGLSADGEPQGNQERVGVAGGEAQPALAFGNDGNLVTLWQELSEAVVEPIDCNLERIQSRLWRLGCGEAGELCLAGRFALSLAVVDPRVPGSPLPGGGTASPGHPEALGPDAGYFWFFARDNVEVVAKVIDGRALNGHFWVFFGGLTDLAFELAVVDTVSGEQRLYRSPAGKLAATADTAAFEECDFPCQPLRLSTAVLDRTAFAGGDDTPRPEAEPTLRAEASELIDSAAGPCSPPELPVVPRPGLCLAGERFEVEAQWRDFAGNEGVGEGVPLGDDSGYFWFFDPDNPELIVKVLDGRALNGRFWVFYGALSNVQYDLQVSHVDGSAVASYRNPLGHLGGRADTSALRPPSECGCTTLYAPVCGRDGVTYGNECEARCLGWVEPAHAGVCTP